ncbi:uncharacterized protein LOC5512624 [Nematostella vectensis]|uniref:uncharacterized protein LOC5512624 n=1 Tax=Nematostella vectensis TaxID=45351 RepID=UPI0020776728|nr:uncharacterized protein LOC5512624 [Nematostella vectensis]
MSPQNVQETRRTMLIFLSFGFVSYFVSSFLATSAEDLLGGKTLPTGHVYLAVALPFSVLPTTVPYLFDRIPALVWIGLLFPLNHLGILAVALCRVEWVRLVGVFSLSTAASLSDVTAISLTAHFHKRTVTAYCSGLGFATFFAPMYYTGTN